MAVQILPNPAAADTAVAQSAPKGLGAQDAGTLHANLAEGGSKESFHNVLQRLGKTEGRTSLKGKTSAETSEGTDAADLYATFLQAIPLVVAPETTTEPQFDFDVDGGAENAEMLEIPQTDKSRFNPDLILGMMDESTEAAPPTTDAPIVDETANATDLPSSDGFVRKEALPPVNRFQEERNDLSAADADGLPEGGAVITEADEILDETPLRANSQPKDVEAKQAATPVADMPQPARTETAESEKPRNIADIDIEDPEFQSQVVARNAEGLKSFDRETSGDDGTSARDALASRGDHTTAERGQRNNEGTGNEANSEANGRNAAQETRSGVKKNAAAKAQGTNSEPAEEAGQTRARTAASGSFASELLDSLRQRGDSATEVRETSGSSQRAGTTYFLNAREAFGEGLTKVLEFIRSDGAMEARIVVEPPALGRIDVTLNTGTAGLEATFKVENESLKQMVQQQIDTLRTSLQAQGIHVSSLAVDIRNKEDQKGRADAQGTGRKVRKAGGEYGLEDDLAEGTSLVRLDLEKGLLHWVA